MGKSRVGPTKKTTIPRMELQAAVLGVKLANFLEKELPYPNMEFFFWTDSLIVLGWILNESKRFHVYVENRANFIRTHSDTTKWRHICSEHNPADIASRGATPRELKESCLWWHGPPEILRDEVKRANPPRVSVPDDPEERRSKEEMRPACSLHTRGKETEWTRLPTLPEVLESVVLPEEVVETEVRKTEHVEEPWLVAYARKFSSWDRLVRVVSRLIQFRYNCKKGNEKIKVTDSMEVAENLIIRSCQKFYLRDVYRKLEDAPYPRSAEEMKERKRNLHTTRVMQLDPYMDKDKCLRVGGRVKRANLPLGEMHPILLPKESHVTKLVVWKWHKAVNHLGTNTTLNRIRQAGVWILQGRRLVQMLVNACVRCRRLRAPLLHQKMSDLPAERLQPVPPFTYSAVDLFGPFQVKVLRSRQKRWICIYVCLSCRGIHLEIVHSLSTSSFLQATRRFTGRRGPMKSLHCDRGTNFVGGKNETEAAHLEIDFDKVKTALEVNGCEMIEYKFNVPKASHMAGAWERQIRTVRSALSHTIAQEGEELTDETLYMLAVEAECIVNSRPLSYLDHTDANSPEPLSPSRLLTLKPHHVRAMPGHFTADDRYSRNRWRYSQFLSDQFWSRYIREVYPELQSRKKWQQPRNNLKVGDVVLVCEENSLRLQWPMGRIIETTRSKDGLTRKVKVLIGRKVYERPIHKMVKLLTEDTDCRTRES